MILAHLTMWAHSLKQIARQSLGRIAEALRELQLSFAFCDATH
jgi:hypothetical protein